MKNLVIIGGGAAGLMAAYSAAKESNGKLNITVVEKNNRPARKIMITGKGRCNLTNNCNIDTFIANIPKNGRFLFSAFSKLSSTDVMNLFENFGVPLKTERGNRVFPVSDKAVDIVDALVDSVKKESVRIVEGEVESVKCEDGQVFSIWLKNGHILPADSVIIATGGLSYPLTGSTGDGYKFAKSLGHTVTDLKPSLVSLECHEGFCYNLSGLSLKNVKLSLFEDDKKKPIYEELGELLFTHFGISGPLVLSASSHIRYMDKKKYRIEIDLKPALSEELLDKRLLRDFSSELNSDFSNSLNALLPKSLVPTVIKLSGIEPTLKVNQISKAQRTSLISVLKHFTLNISAYRPIDEAIITSGGISVKEINPATMESKITSGLYFAGEVIDVDAYTGGFNLQIAFSTGYCAGKSAAQSLI